MSEPATLQIEIGRSYRTHGGQKATVKTRRWHRYCWAGDIDGYGTRTWDSDGRYCSGETSLDDLVGPWEDPAPAPAEGEKVYNARGGSQSHVPFRFDLAPPKATLKVCEILHLGSHHGEENWRKISIREHVNHAVVHVLKYMCGYRDECHLGNATCRLLFALELFLEGESFNGPVVNQSEESPSRCDPAQPGEAGRPGH